MNEKISCVRYFWENHSSVCVWMKIHLNKSEIIVNELRSTGFKFEEVDAINHLFITLSPEYNSTVAALGTMLSVNEQNILLDLIKNGLLNHKIKQKRDKNYKKQLTSADKSFYPEKKKIFRIRITMSPVHVILSSWLFIITSAKKAKLKKIASRSKRKMKYPIQRKINIKPNHRILLKLPKERSCLLLKLMIVYFHFSQMKVKCCFRTDSESTDHCISNDSYFVKSIILKKRIAVGLAKRGSEMFAIKIGNLKLISDTGVICFFKKCLCDRITQKCNFGSSDREKQFSCFTFW